jgi:hypothetical protein
MIHNVILAACIGAALTVLLAALWTLIGNKVDPQAGAFSGHRFAQPRNQSARRQSADAEAKKTSERSLPGGWSLIQRTIRARHDIHLAAK